MQESLGSTRRNANTLTLRGGGQKYRLEGLALKKETVFFSEWRGGNDGVRYREVCRY